MLSRIFLRKWLDFSTQFAATARPGEDGRGELCIAVQMAEFFILLKGDFHSHREADKECVVGQFSDKRGSQRSI